MSHENITAAIANETMRALREGGKAELMATLDFIDKQIIRPIAEGKAKLLPIFDGGCPTCGTPTEHQFPIQWPALLERYGKHAADCKADADNELVTCTCGLMAALHSTTGTTLCKSSAAEAADRARIAELADMEAQYDQLRALRKDEGKRLRRIVKDLSEVPGLPPVRKELSELADGLECGNPLGDCGCEGTCFTCGNCERCNP